MGINVQMSKSKVKVSVHGGLMGFTHDGYWIIDPYSSICGRFEVDPRKEYGLTVDQATEISEFNGDMAEFMSPAQSMRE